MRAGPDAGGLVFFFTSKQVSAGVGAGGLVSKHMIGKTCVPDEGLFHMCKHRFF